MKLRDRETVHAECEDWGEDRVQAYVDAHLDDAERIYRLEWLNLKARAANKQAADPAWAAIPPEIQRAITASWALGMSPMASALYGRWWQLETWLRSLIYVELKAALGDEWVETLEKRAESRQLKDDSFRYMATPDAQNRLAYTDASVLFKIMEEHWDLFESSLLAKNVWAGRVEELLAIRNRIGHCRRPHADDLARLEQTLRDLNGGAFLATSTFNRQFNVEQNWTDAVVDGWVHMHHNQASLVEHASRQYDTFFQLHYSHRPWAKSFIGQATISGLPGYIWHASWYLRGSRPFNLNGFWRSIEPFHNTILMLCADSPSAIEVSFSAMDDPKIIVDAIGECLDAAIRNIGYGHVDNYTQWQERYAELDPRVQIATPWSLIDKSMQGVSIFSA